MNRGKGYSAPPYKRRQNIPPQGAQGSLEYNGFYEEVVAFPRRIQQANHYRRNNPENYIRSDQRSREDDGMYKGGYEPDFQRHPQAHGYHRPQTRNFGHEEHPRNENMVPGFSAVQSHHRQSNSRGRGNFVPRGSHVNERGGRNEAFRKARRYRDEPRSMSFRQLEDLLQKEEEELIAVLMNDRKGFTLLCEGDRITNDTIILIVKVLRKVCELSFDQTKYSILQSSLNESFVDILKNFIATLPLQNTKDKLNSKYFWNNTDDFWNNLLAISSHILDAIPTFAVVRLENILKPLEVYIPTFEKSHQVHISDEIKDNVTKLNQHLVDLSREYETKKKYFTSTLMDDEDGEPPDDFRQISVYPSPMEILNNQQGFLRKNVVTGAYQNVDHYLDVQFRLLREDFVGPLRSGIGNYLSKSQDCEKNRLENIRIYKNIQFLNPETVNDSYCIRIRWESNKDKKKKKVDMQYNRKFMYGSLLCFTRNKFKSMFFGKVASRKIEDLQIGELIIGFDHNPRVAYNENYTMIECSVYFEPYYHVLTVLQTMPVDNFPMEKYLIKLDTTLTPPEYIDYESIYNIDNKNCHVMRLSQYGNFYGLNDSQLVAFKAAITQEFTLIQGPPGTGKTFLGLKIAETLLNNSKFWYKRSPMLVVCFTNHALDQFLEGLIPKTEKIIRVGGQSKNPAMEQFNLMNVKRKNKYDQQAVYLKKNEVRQHLSKIAFVSDSLKHINQYSSVTNFSAFESVVVNYTYTWFYSASQDAINEWLLGGREIHQPNHLIREVIDNEINQDVDDDDDDDEEVDDWPETEAIKDDDVFDSIIESTGTGAYRVSISLEDILKSINVDQEQLHEISPEEVFEREEIQREIQRKSELYDYLKWRLDVYRNSRDLKFIQKPDLRKPEYMHPDDRWCLYFMWLDLLKNSLVGKLNQLDNEYRKIFKIYEELRSVEDVAIMKQSLVIGMTTTCAARLRSTLSTLKSPIVIVEEAAEVLEAHIIASLTNKCQQLILIGDHQQLKPNTSNYRVETKYKLGISLFERMVMNKIQCYSLNVQHRMRPEISSLIRPSIYENLVDHPDVHDRDPISGIDNCLYFIDHENAEQECDGASKKNLHESRFLVKLAKHLRLNGYKSEDITILAAYLGQMFEIQKAKKCEGPILEGIRVSVLDNYQGEESKIILLSLVRNNELRKVGFLKIDNRICVALSRARDGMYIMGNMNHLCNASELWVKIRSTLQDLKGIGPELNLRCQIHTETVTKVKSYEDFLEIPEGGCTRKCEAPIPCGHYCKSVCHIKDRHHTDYKCREICNKSLCESDPTNHICRKMCFEECGPCIYKVQRNLKCGHDVLLECYIDVDEYECVVLMDTTLLCGHRAMKACYRSIQTFKCPHPCETKVEPCGHACTRSCHVQDDPDHFQYKCRKPCAKFRDGCTMEINTHLCTSFCYEECVPCDIIVKKRLTNCGHMYDVPCNSNVNMIECRKPCKRLLDCGHVCKNQCFEPCGPCRKMVEKKLPICGHNVTIECSKLPDRGDCNGKCPLSLPCGHKCTKKCNEACSTTVCKNLIEVSTRGRCGHLITQIECRMKADVYSDDIMKFCRKPCGVELKCGHICAGSCGECFQGRIHKRCSAKCGVLLVCDHECSIPCREACKPCVLPCPYFCVHSKCKKKCGDLCTPCKEECPRKCQHQRCRNFCGQMCSVQPCNKPCMKRLLKCRHPCVGFCGDPCPPFCRICDKAELEEIFFGNEDEPESRFVYLNDCKHVMENNGMEMWLKQGENEIKFKVCPKCKTPIKTTQRYSDFIKKSMGEINSVKVISFGMSKENEIDRTKLLEDLDAIRSQNLHVEYLKKITNKMIGRLQPIGKDFRRQNINKMVLTALRGKMQILQHLNKILKDSKLDIIFTKQIALIVNGLKHDDDSITQQEIDDINLELGRLQRFVTYVKLKNSPYFDYKCRNNAQVKILITTIESDDLQSLQRYTNSLDEYFKEHLKELVKLLKMNVAITETERREIVQAMGLQKGHWFKCKNGHPYVITECGGAMERSFCPVCKEPIGGTNHALDPTNAVATEMDGARFGAWSEAANLNNFVLD